MCRRPTFGALWTRRPSLWRGTVSGKGRGDARAHTQNTAPQPSHHPSPPGESFEQKILANEKANSKFSFLTEGDPYHAYYRARIEAARRGDDAPLTAAPPPAVNASAADKAAAAAAAAKTVLPSSVAGGGAPLAPPPPPRYAVSTPGGLTAQDLDVLRLTAAAVAVNGDAFADGLADREAANPAFAFLRSTHSLHPFFQALTCAYTAVASPDDTVLPALHADATDRTAPLHRALARLEWEKATRADAAAKDAEETAEREAVASIDWHAFIVVETIAFYEGEEADLPPPRTLRDVVAANKAALGRSAPGVPPPVADAADVAAGRLAPPPPPPPAAAATTARMTAEERAMVEAAAAVGDEGTAAPPPAATTATVAAPADDDDDEDAHVPVVKDYVRPAAGAAAAAAATAGGAPPTFDATRFAVSPFTGELVPVDAMAEHMRVSLLDPKWRSQRETMLAKVRTTTTATDDEIVSNLVSLASRRPDVFGDAGGEGAAEAARAALARPAVGVAPAPGGGVALPTAAGPGAPPPGSSFYGGARPMAPPPPPGMGGGWRPPVHPDLPPGVEAGPPGVPPGGACGGPPPPRSFYHGPPPPRPFYGGPPPPMQYAPPGGMAPPPPPLAPPPPGDGPPPKRARGAADAAPFVLAPADEFAAAHAGVEVALTVDVADGVGGAAAGTSVTITLPSVEASIADVKALLEPLTGLPPNKQKLSDARAGMLADRHTLAHYNVAPGATLSLALKTRGRR